MTPVQKAYAELLSRHGKLTRCEEETNDDDPIFAFKTEGGKRIKLDCMAVELRHALTSTETFIDFVASHYEEMTKDPNGKVGLKFSTALMSLCKRDDTLFAEFMEKFTGVDEENEPMMNRLMQKVGCSLMLVREVEAAEKDGGAASQ